MCIFPFHLACHSLAEFYMAVEKDITKAKDLYYHTCYKLGFADSCFALGNLFLTQKGWHVMCLWLIENAFYLRDIQFLQNTGPYRNEN